MLRELHVIRRLGFKTSIYISSPERHRCISCKSLSITRTGLLEPSATIAESLGISTDWKRTVMASTKGTKLLPLRPKADPSPFNPCGLRACRQRVCNLISHRRHAIAIKNQQRRTRSRHDGQAVLESRLELPNPPLEPTIARGGGFPTLPSGTVDSPVTRQLFHDFFARIIDRVHMLLVPPRDRQSDQAWLERRRRDMFYLGSTSALDCINCILAAYIQIVPRLASEHIPDAVAESLQVTLIRNLRNSLNNYHPQDSVRILSTISTLVMLEHKFGRKTSLLAHRTAMIRIVDSCGGLQNNGFAIPFIVNLDKNIAIQIGEPPVYTPWSSVSTPIQRASRYPEVYGSFFVEDSRNEIQDEDVIMYCTEVCRAIEILESEQWTFNYAEYKHTSEIYYLYFLRSRLSGKYAHLNARYVHASSQQRCILLATKIVEYITLMDNTLPAISASIANKLYEILGVQTTAKTWDDRQDVLSWIISVLVSVPGQWEGRSWAVALHHARLTNEYGEAWPDDWKQTQLSRMKRFVWSTTRLDARLISESRVVSEGNLQDVVSGS